MNYILEVQGLKKGYAKNNFQLNDISFRVPYGAIMGLIGKNGAGKTTTLKAILHTIQKDEGSIKIFGKEMTDDDVEMREKIGVVFDTNSLPSYLTAEKVAKIYKEIYANWDDDYFYRLLERFQIPSKQKIKEYSRGMTMTLCIITTLAYRPQLLILDEATGGLDPVRRDELLEVFLEFVENEKNSILFSSHITTDLEKIADYVTYIDNGNTILSEVKDELLYKYGIVRCGREQFERIDKSNVLTYLKRDYEYTVLVSDTQQLKDENHDFIIDSPTLEEITVLLAKGDVS